MPYYFRKTLLRGLFPFVLTCLLGLLLKLLGIPSIVIRNVFIAGVILSLLGLASVTYNVKEWSMAMRSLAHLAILLLTVFPTLLLSGWFRLVTVGDYTKLFLGFLIVVMALWVLGVLLRRLVFRKKD